MKLVIIEPLGVEKDKLLSIAQNALKDSVEIVYYDTKTTDTQELIELSLIHISEPTIH